MHTLGVRACHGNDTEITFCYYFTKMGESNVDLVARRSTLEFVDRRRDPLWDTGVTVPCQTSPEPRYRCTP